VSEVVELTEEAGAVLAEFHAYGVEFEVEGLGAVIAVDHKRNVRQERWSMIHWTVFRQAGGLELWALEWEAPLTEMQEGQDPWGYTRPELFRVRPMSKKVTNYMRMEG